MAPIASSVAQPPPPDNSSTGAGVFLLLDTPLQLRWPPQEDSEEQKHHRAMKIPPSDEAAATGALAALDTSSTSRTNSFVSCNASSSISIITTLPSPSLHSATLAATTAVSPLSTNEAPLNEFVARYKSRLESQQQLQQQQHREPSSALQTGVPAQPLLVETGAPKVEPSVSAAGATGHLTRAAPVAAVATPPPLPTATAKSVRAKKKNPSPKRAREAPSSSASASRLESESSDSSTSTMMAASAGTMPTKAFKCTFPGCGKEFQLKGNLKRHQNIHRGDKQFRCKFCGKDFLRKADMEVHHRVHTGEKPYTCKVDGCDKSFARRSDLLSHERTHEGTKPFACLYPDCGRHFARKFDLQKHQRMHDNHSSECQKRRKLSSPAAMSDDCNCWTSASSLDSSASEFKPTPEVVVVGQQLVHAVASSGPSTPVAAAHSSPPPCSVPSAPANDVQSVSPQHQLRCTQDHIHSPPMCFAAFTSVDSLDTFLLSPQEAFDVHSHASSSSSSSSPPLSAGSHASCCGDHVHPSIKQQLEALDIGREAGPYKQQPQPQTQQQTQQQTYTQQQTQQQTQQTQQQTWSYRSSAVVPGTVPAALDTLATARKRSMSLVSATSCPMDAELLEGYAKHTPSCGHLSIVHGNHRDYVVKNHLVCPDSVRSISGGEHHLAKPSARCPESEPHRPGCGHLPVRHRDHIDYVVEDNLFCQHAGLLNDASIADNADHIELLDDDFWDFYGAIGSLTTE